MLNQSRHTTITRATTVAIATLFAFAVLEIAVRVLAPQVLVGPLHEEVDGVIAPTPGARIQFVKPGEFSSRIAINEQRFRADGPTAPSASTLRIAMLGDSMTFGYGVDNDETYPYYLQQRLNTALGGARRVEILNAGVIETGTGEQALWYDRWVSRFHSAVVVLNAFHNDFDDDETRQLFVREKGGFHPRASGYDPRGTSRWLRRYVPAYSYLVQHSHLVALTRVAVSRWLASPATAEKDVPRKAAADPDFLIAAGERQAAEIRHLHDRVAADGATLIVVLIPRRGALYPETDSDAGRREADAMERVVSAVCRERHIALFSPEARLRDLLHQSGQRFYFATDAHLTRAGNDALAMAVADFLRPILEGVALSTPPRDR